MCYKDLFNVLELIRNIPVNIHSNVTYMATCMKLSNTNYKFKVEKEFVLNLISW